MRMFQKLQNKMMREQNEKKRLKNSCSYVINAQVYQCDETK